MAEDLWHDRGLGFKRQRLRWDWRFPRAVNAAFYQTSGQVGCSWVWRGQRHDRNNRIQREKEREPFVTTEASRKRDL